jgi:peptide-methionine (S)-S-oxide reductase
MARLILGGGCFWCLEAVFQRVKGVTQVIPGYCGGTLEKPDYKTVCSGTSGHAEVVEITYDESIISLAQLLEIFFTIHDPTTLNRQGNDIGPQYRSIVFYQNEQQKLEIEKAIQRAQADYREPIVTQVVPQQTFWPAEEYHHNYFNNNSNQPYCQVVVGQKIEKLYCYFSDKGLVTQSEGNSR